MTQTERYDNRSNLDVLISDIIYRKNEADRLANKTYSKINFFDNKDKQNIEREEIYEKKTYDFIDNSIIIKNNQMNKQNNTKNIINNGISLNN